MDEYGLSKRFIQHRQYFNEYLKLNRKPWSYGVEHSPPYVHNSDQHFLKYLALNPISDKQLVKYLTTLLSSIIKAISGFKLLYHQLPSIYPVSKRSLCFHTVSIELNFLTSALVAGNTYVMKKFQLEGKIGISAHK